MTKIFKPLCFYKIIFPFRFQSYCLVLNIKNICHQFHVKYKGKIHENYTKQFLIRNWEHLFVINFHTYKSII